MTRGLMFDQMQTYIHDKNEIHKAVAFVKKYKFNDVTFYANSVIPSQSENVKYMMEKLRLVGVSVIRVAIGSTREADKMLVFHNEQALFDGLWLEYEWWNHTPRDFSHAIFLLQYMQNIFPRWVDIGAYIGRVQDDELQQLVNNTDRLFIHSYIDHPDKTYTYAKQRYDGFKDTVISNDKKYNIVPLFSTEFHPCEVCNQGRSNPDYSNKMCFLGRWMSMNNEPPRYGEVATAFEKVEDFWFASYNMDNDAWDNKAHPSGFYYYAYTHALKNGIN